MQKQHPIYGILNRESTNPDLKRALVFDKHGKVFKFETLSHNSIVADGIEKTYGNWEAFEAANTPMPELDAIHKALFGHPVPKKATHIDATVAIYAKWASNAEDRTGATGTPKDPVTGRKSTIGTRIYTVLWDGKTAIPLKTPQAIACLKIISEEAKPADTTERDPEGKDIIVQRPQINETDLKAKVMERQAELKTQQHPWRIFQYYRPQLLAAHLIRHN